RLRFPLRPGTPDPGTSSRTTQEEPAGSALQAERRDHDRTRIGPSGKGRPEGTARTVSPEHPAVPHFGVQDRPYEARRDHHSTVADRVRFDRHSGFGRGREATRRREPEGEGCDRGRDESRLETGEG